MKISEFAARFGVKNDTVRYYMDLNLIIPVKKGGHYHFDEKCVEDMQEVLKLKKMEFSLQEIKDIFNFKRIGKLTSYQQLNYYQGLYRQKIREIEEKIDELIKAKEELEEKIAELLSDQNQMTTIGIDLSVLKLFSCPECNHELLLSAEKVEANQVIEGSLHCDCGKSLHIKNGILYAGDPDSYAEQGDNRYQNHIEDYIKTTNPDFIDESYQSLDWMQRQLGFETLSGKVIMEPGSGYGFFLRQIYENLPADSVYICIDNNPQLNKYLKQMLEMTSKRAKIIFITGDLPELPLKDHVIDLLFDFTGTSCFAFENRGFLTELLKNYLKEQATLLATFIIYQKFGPNNIVPEPFRKNFTYKNIKEELININFKIENEFKSESQTIQKSMGKYESFAQPGDQIYSYQILAKRSG